MSHVYTIKHPYRDDRRIWNIKFCRGVVGLHEKQKNNLDKV